MRPTIILVVVVLVSVIFSANSVGGKNTITLSAEGTRRFNPRISGHGEHFLRAFAPGSTERKYYHGPLASIEGRKKDLAQTTLLTNVLYESFYAAYCILHPNTTFFIENKFSLDMNVTFLTTSFFSRPETFTFLKTLRQTVEKHTGSSSSSSSSRSSSDTDLLMIQGLSINIYTQLSRHFYSAVVSMVNADELYIDLPLLLNHILGNLPSSEKKYELVLSLINARITVHVEQYLIYVELFMKTFLKNSIFKDESYSVRFLEDMRPSSWENYAVSFVKRKPDSLPNVLTFLSCLHPLLISPHGRNLLEDYSEDQMSVLRSNIIQAYLKMIVGSSALIVSLFTLFLMLIPTYMFTFLIWALFQSKNIFVFAIPFAIYVLLSIRLYMDFHSTSGKELLEKGNISGHSETGGGSKVAYSSSRLLNSIESPDTSSSGLAPQVVSLDSTQADSSSASSCCCHLGIFSAAALGFWIAL